MSTLRVNTLQDVAGTGQPAMVGAAKAWVNFNGTGTVAIRASFNVSSITDIGTGNYSVNFTTAMVDANYSAVVSGPQGSNGSNITILVMQNAHATTSCSVVQTATGPGGGGPTDSALINVAVFR